MDSTGYGASHSLALTWQVPYKVPESFQNTVLQSHGQLYLLNKNVGGFISRAKRLREHSASADIVVFHAWEHDVIPTIAFANKAQSPPIIYVNHGDHCFWLGASISDVVANLRESGLHLSQHRRGIEPKRNMLLPTVLTPCHRVLSQVEAKQQLGFPESSILLLSIARAPKYRTLNGLSFADAHVPLLQQNGQVFLLVVGPGESQDWSTAIQQTQGRIRVLPETADTAVFYQAADIYVDSFPFISNTSLLEAGSYGLPLVSRYPFSDACEILGADMPGLTGNLIRVRELEEYLAVLSRLVNEQDYRRSLGAAVKQKITETHLGNHWLFYLEEIYRCAITLPQVIPPSPSLSRISIEKEQIFLGEPDLFCPKVHGLDFDLDIVFKHHLTLLPAAQRWREWLRLVKKPGFYHQGDRFSPFKYLAPEWLLGLIRQLY
jgi:hypothetical protein